MSCLQAVADEAPKFKLLSPSPFQVFQRTGTAFGQGFADVVVRAEVAPDLAGATWEYDLSQQSDASKSVWKPLPAKVQGALLEAKIRVPAGWGYSLTIRQLTDGKPKLLSTVAPFGVGEVFLVAGQSYATNCNDERLFPTDPEHRVIAFDTQKGTWAVANDPQPTGDGSDGGSIWPPVGDALVKELGVPVAFANVAVGGTSSIEWQPDGKLHPNLVKAGQALGQFRAVLWQQGESDVIVDTPAETYVSNIRTIRDTAAKAWGVNPPWLLAKSTLHPTVYNYPDREARIRGAIDTLTTLSGYRPGPDTDTLKDENRGGEKSRRHFSAIGQRNAAAMWVASIRKELFADPASKSLRVGVAEADITPPLGFPMSGYYNERLADGELDPLKAKAIVLREGQTVGAWVGCDLIGISTDLKNEVRRLASAKTGIPPECIALSATHSHTGPDYGKALYLKLGGESQEPVRAAYIDKLIGGIVDAIASANAAAKPAQLDVGSATQNEPVSFNRRGLTRDGSVKTWMGASHPDYIRPAGPIDPEIGLLVVRDEAGMPLGILSNFALHLDTVGGLKWSADYPFFIERTLRQATGAPLVSLFGNGCCGDINHINPRSSVRNKADFIGQSLGNSIVRDLPSLQPVASQKLVVKSRTIQLPLQDATKEEVDRSIEILNKAKRNESVDFFDHVTAYKKLIIDQMRHKDPHAKTADHITWGLSRSLAGVGETLPVDLTVFTVGTDLAIIALPGETFVNHGLAIKQASPFRTTLVIELSNCVETIYVPTRAAYAGGSYEVTNSTTMPGSGELVVQNCVELLREAAAEATAAATGK
ncbi:MAG: neutral/alkaline non-lysosomal ceramidase N-terminal domain-containing protein [Planctomycetaceae bacterium]